MPNLLVRIGLLAALAASVAPAGAAVFTFSTGDPDGAVAVASRPSSPGKIEIESADDFVLSSTTHITGATFTGLITGGATEADVGVVAVEIYRVFPLDSTIPPAGTVPTRVNSPSDVVTQSRTTPTELSFSTTLLNPSFNAANTVLSGINPLPNQTTGGEGAVSGREVRFDVIPSPAIDLPPGHYFFVPQVQVTGGEFRWLSAPMPITGGTGPFSPDLQTWIRNASLAPDWLRIGTDITGQAPINAAFSLTGHTPNLVADYEFSSSRASSVGTPPDVADLGPGTNAFAIDSVEGQIRPVLGFPQHNGVSLSPTTGVVPSDRYTIAMLVRLDATAGFRRLVDFTGGQSDCGLYVLSGTLNFFCGVAGTGSIVAGRYATIVLTRDAAGTVAGYVDGNLELSFADGANIGVVSAANTLRFFRDNECSGGPCGEDAAGAVAVIRLYDDALGPADVATLQLLPEDAGFLPADKVTAKCEGGVAKALAKLAVSDMKCHTQAAHAAVAGKPFDEEACENKATTKFAKTSTKGCPACVDLAALAPIVERTADQQTGPAYCAGTTPLGDTDDTGFVPPDKTTAKCEDRVAKAAAKLVSAVTACHTKAADAALKHKPFDEETCETAASAKLGATSTKGCPPCIDLGDIFFAFEPAAEGMNGGAYCAGSVRFGGAFP